MSPWGCRDGLDPALHVIVHEGKGLLWVGVMAAMAAVAASSLSPQGAQCLNPCMAPAALHGPCMNLILLCGLDSPA